jgi:uncharacterized protein
MNVTLKGRWCFMTTIKILRWPLFIALGLLLEGCSHLFFWPSPWIYDLPELHGVAYENHYVKVNEKETLNFWYFKKSPKNGQARPFVLFFHGNAQNISSHYQQWLWALQGLDLLIFDYQGYGQSSGASGQRQAVEDGEFMLTYAFKIFKEGQARGEYDRFVVYGQSLGGILLQRALEAESVKDVRIDLLVLDSTFLSYQELAKDLSRRFSWPWSGLRFLVPLLISQKWAPLLTPKAHIQSLLVVHGKKDKVVPFSFGRELFAKFPLLLPQKQFWEIEDGEHIDIFMRNDGHYREKFLQLLK